LKIKWLGHACFMITSASGTRIITDPYTRRSDILYGEINESAEVVTISHEHNDHNNAAAIHGQPVILRKSGTVKNIDFKVIPGFHDDTSGSRRGPDTIFCFTVDGVRICHTGDLGYVPDAKTVDEIGQVDVLMIPAGGTYTIEPETASQIADKINPRVVLPMHYLTDKIKMPIKGVDVFLKYRKNVKRLDTSELEFELETLPKGTETIVLKPAR
jgi:L-ascorbate metabolism protein UlaG (beta-lactamase superfamily)